MASRGVRLVCAVSFLVLVVMMRSTAAVEFWPVPPMYDDAGRPKAITYSAKRIITLAPSLTELVYAAGAHGQLVGVSAYSNFPEGATDKPQVADATGVSIEALLALQPDLVLAWKGGTRPADIARLESLGLNVFVIDIRWLADVPRALRTIGKLTGRPNIDNTPERVSVTFESKLQMLQMANKDKAPVRVFFEISQMPLMTINGQHFISETIKLCGGVNVFSDVAQVVLEPSREALLQRGADVILRPASIHNDVARDKALYSGLAAYGSNRVYAVNADWILRPGPRVLLAAGEICKALDLRGPVWLWTRDNLALKASSPHECADSWQNAACLCWSILGRCR
ncbi:MAG: helical backbone metal receptor [Burkholderiales bacterium]|nr:helical backbone metal receptor [Burkholderiales bacterium]